MKFTRIALGVALGLACCSTARAGADWGLREGNPELKSAGPLAFGPDGILFVGDTKGAAVFAIGTGDVAGSAEKMQLNVADVGGKLAAMFKTKPESIQVNDLAVNPRSGQVYLSVHATMGKKTQPALVRVNADGNFTQVALKNVPFSRVQLENVPADRETTRRGRKYNPRDSSITDLAYSDGKVLVAGVSTEKAPSIIREIVLPFSQGQRAASVEIYHGAHGRYEDTAVIRTFIPMTIDGEPNLLAGFTCTPLVKFPVDQLKPAAKTRGTTVAELGNRNTPLDMIMYQKDGKEFLLMANDRRGVMKISTENIDRDDGIVSKISGTSGQTYETLEAFTGVTQLDKLGDAHAVMLMQNEAGMQTLKTVELP